MAVGAYAAGPRLAAHGGEATGPVKIHVLLPLSRISGVLSGGITEAVKMYLANGLVTYAHNSQASALPAVSHRR